jgi:folate-binding protein YgfZ
MRFGTDYRRKLSTESQNSPMTDTNLAVSVLPTPLSNFLATAAKPPKTADHLGVLTPQQFDAPADETAALSSEAAVHDLGWMRRVTVRGEDRFRWLNGMVTNSVKDIATHGGAWNMVLNAQGRIQGDLVVWRRGETADSEAPGSETGELDLEIAADQFDRLSRHMDHFIIMDDVELVPHDPAGETVIGLTGPQADKVLGRMGLPTLAEALTSVSVEWNGLDLWIVRAYGVLVPHYELWTPIAGLPRLWRTLSTAGARPVGTAALETFRIAEGIPAYGVDIAERDLPQETSQTRGLHFNKGCYLGQEIVERIRSRGNVHRHLRHLELDGPLAGPGAELTIEGVAAGQITSASELPLAKGSRKFALGMIRGEAEAKNGPLEYSVEGVAGVARLLAEPPRL